jgi:NTP pyrophosphatase (non-canonical NTP hydrolase)
MDQYIDIVFDGPPSHESGRFVEVENEHGASINAGEWIQTPLDGASGWWRLRLKVAPSLNNLAVGINQIARDHGFWEENRNMGEMLMLAVSELSEALEEHRDGKPNVYHEFKMSPGMPIPNDLRPTLDKMERNLQRSLMTEPNPMEELTGEEMSALAAAGFAKPEGLAVELADCIIRCLDTLHSLGVDIDQVVADKMAYNRSRPYKHGRKF